jgi:hypothetical protein
MTRFRETTKTGDNTQLLLLLFWRKLIKNQLQRGKKNTELHP